MPEKLLVELNPPRLEVEPGAAPVEATITLQNLGNVVEQYTAEVVGLDPDWFTAPVASVALFPQDRDQLRVLFHPPKRPGLRAGSYPFRIVVRSRGGAQEQTVEGTLDVRGFAVYRVDLTPRRQTARGRGKYRVQLVNTGSADVRLELQARDEEEACRFRLPDDLPLVSAGSKNEVTLFVQPKKRPWIGPERSYDFTLTAKPQDARGDPQNVPGQFTYRPLLRSWAPFRRMLYLVAAMLGLSFLFSLGVSTGTVREFPRRVQIASAQLQGVVCKAPMLDRMCPSDAMAAKPLPEPETCSFDFGFKEFATTFPELVGECTSNVAYDSFGNGIQYTTNGVLFWLKASNTVYYFAGDALFGFIDKKLRLLDGTGR